MSSVEFGKLLLATLSPDKNMRETAVAQLENASKENLALYMDLLINELAREDGDPNVRQAAGIAAKNTLTAKEAERRNQLFERWKVLDLNAKTIIRQKALQILNTREAKIGTTAAQLIAAIAAVDVPLGLWPDMIPVLLSNVTNNPNNPNLKRASLEAIGYVCEEIDPNILTAHANQILTAVVSGARSDEPSNEVRLASLTALFNSLEFVRDNFNNEGERNYIMQVVCEATQSPAPLVQVAAFECLVRIMSLYYDYMAPYMARALFALTVEAMKSENEGVALQAIEFWSTICDEEIELSLELSQAQELNQQPDRISQNFAKASLAHTIPVLTMLLTKRTEDDDDDEWNVPMAAGTCLSLMANCVENDIINHVLPFVERNVTNQDWRFRDASIMAFGSILEGPSPSTLQPFVMQALPIIIQSTTDRSVQVQDTASWTLGRVCNLVPDSIKTAQNLPLVINALVSGLRGTPKVSSNCAWAIMNIAEDMDEDEYLLGPYFENIAQALLATSERQDGDESNLRTAAYEALSALITSSVEVNHIIVKLTEVMLYRLQQSIQLETQIVSVDDRLNHSELQANICAVLQAIIRKLGNDVKPFADMLMQAFLRMFSSSGSASILEDALLAVSSLVTALDKDFIRYMEAFFPFLCVGLQNHQEYQVCSISVGIVGDVCRALGESVLPFCNTFITVLLQNLQSPVLHRSVKPPILSCFGDIALAIGPKFSIYLNACMDILRQACSMRATEDDYDMIEYVNELREGILEAYTGIVQGMKDKQQLFPYVEHMVLFIGEVIYRDTNKNEAVTRGSVGLLGDICDMCGKDLAPLVSKSTWIRSFVGQAAQSKNQSTKEVASWTTEVFRRNQLL